ncbi:MAG: tyrosine-type recombinase/integrase [Butyricicoccus sp.]
MSEVHVRQRRRKDGTIRYEYRFEIASIDRQRKWISKSGFKKKSDAQKAGRQAMMEYENTGVVANLKDMSTSDFLDLWMENDVQLTCASTTIANYAKKIRLYIVPVIGKYYLRSVNKPQLQKLLVDMYKASYARNSIVVVRGILSKSFQWAEDNHYISHSPANHLHIPKAKAEDKVVSRTEPHVFIPPEKIRMIFEHFPYGTPNHIPLMFGYKCGVRLGEAFAFFWEDIDFEKHTLSINRQVQWHQADEKNPHSYWYFSSPKYNSSRIIDIDSELVDLLKSELDKQSRMKEAYGDYYINYYESDSHILNTDGNGKRVNLVCVRDSGKYIHPRTMQYTSAIIHKELDYPEFDFHSLRHTHTTMLTEKHAPDKYIQHRLGHKKIEVTKNIYTHVTDSILQEGNAILETMF